MFKFEITSKCENIYKVEKFLNIYFEKSQVPLPICNKIELCIIEAVNNSILYGNKKDPQKIIKITISKNKQKIIITIEDEGKGFDFNSIPDPISPENLMKETGRGLYIITSLTDELFFAKNGAKIIMCFSLTNHKEENQFN